MRALVHRPSTIAGLTVIVALMAHGPAAAQMRARTTSPSAPPGQWTTTETAAGPDRVVVPFAGTYQVTLALGADTADIFFRTAADADLQAVIAPAVRGSHGAGATSIPGLSLIVHAEPDTFALPRSVEEPGERISGRLVAALDPAGGIGGIWPITLLTGVDTSGVSPAARLSRLLVAVRVERELVEERCREDPKGANRAARGIDAPEPCDEAAGLPVAQRDFPGDGVLAVTADGRVRIEQRVETSEGEMTMWGRRISRTTMARTGGPL